MDVAMRPGPPIEIVRGRYVARFATDAEELDRAQRLRFEVFNLELNEGLQESHATGRDRDRFDAHCHHLLLQHRKSGEVVGTYRMQTESMAREGEGFYSAGEFDLSGMPPGMLQQSVELGRACIAAEHRSSRTLQLLWKGLASYAVHMKARFFFGCSSLTSQDPAEGMRAYAYLAREGMLTPDFQVEPLPEYRCADPGKAMEVETFALPRLFRTYLKYGTRVCSPPALDREFGTIDFLVLMDTADFDARTRALVR